MSVNEFVIGIETEGFWKGKAGTNLPGPNVEKKHFAEAFVLFYNQIRKGMLRADFSHGSHPGHYKDPDNKRRWIVAIDDAIGDLDIDAEKSLPEGHALEFVSPKFTFCQTSDWRTEVWDHWAMLLLIGEVEVDKMCATHIHVSPKKEKAWSLEQLKQVAKAIIYFDEAFKAIWAPSRRDHGLTQSNKSDNHKLKNHDFAACCKFIDNCAKKPDLIKLMQQTRDYAWNFENTAEGGIGTIEFRCAPGATKAAHCLIWVEFGVSFVQAAAQSDTSQVLEKKVYKGDAEGLKEFILRAGVDGMNRKDLLAIVFQKQNGGTGWRDDDEMRATFDELYER